VALMMAESGVRGAPRPAASSGSAPTYIGLYMYIAVSFEARGNFFPRKKKGALSSDEQGVRWVRATARRGEPPTSARANGSPSAWCFWRQITTVDDGDHGERSARGRALFPPSGAASCWRLDAARAP
jgi:hypothetical protein